MAGDKGRSTIDLVPIVSIINEPADQPGSGSIGVKRDGSFIIIIKVEPVDFDMRTRAEQEGILYRFADMLDSLRVDFPIQILCHNKRLDAEAFTKQYEAQLRNRETSQVKRELIAEFVENYRRQIQINTMVEKEFYVIIPFAHKSSAILTTASENIPLGQFFRLITENTQRKMVQEPKPEDLEIVRDEINIRAAQIEHFLNNMGCITYRLGTDSIRQLFYEFFHPGLAERQKLQGGAGRNIQVVGGTGELDNIRRRRIRSQQENSGNPALEAKDEFPALPPNPEGGF